MRTRVAVPLLLLAAGIGLLAAAVATGGASVFLVLIIPVVAGSSPLLILGVVCIVLAFLSVPFALAPEAHEGPSTAPPSPAGAAPPGEWGGVVVVGPVPFFFGRWRGTRGGAYWLAVLAGIVLLAAARLVVFVLRG